MNVMLIGVIGGIISVAIVTVDKKHERLLDQMVENVNISIVFSMYLSLNRVYIVNIALPP